MIELKSDGNDQQPGGLCAVARIQDHSGNPEVFRLPY